MSLTIWPLLTLTPLRCRRALCRLLNREMLLHDEIIQDKLRVLKRSGLALPYEVWEEFVVDTVVNFALWCQALPASESYHHVGQRGLLLHSLDVAIYAMRLRRNFIMPPNTPPEDVIHREIVWVYGVFVCALLHDSGKINDFDIELSQEGGEVQAWTPVMGPIHLPYRFRYHKGRQYSTHQYMGHTLLTALLGENPMLAISHDKALFHTMMAYLSGHATEDNVIAQIVTQADAVSVAQDLGADKEGINLAVEKARSAPMSLAGQLRLTLAHLLENEQLLLNKKGAEGFVDGELLYLMSKPIAERLRTALLERGITSVPSDNSRLFNELQQHNIIRPNADDMAVWKCDVVLSEFDWHQTFTFICVHWPSIVPEAGFDSLVGTITPVQHEEGADEKTTEDAPLASNALPASDAEMIETETILHDNDAVFSEPQGDVEDELMAFMTQAVAAPMDAMSADVAELETAELVNQDESKVEPEIQETLPPALAESIPSDNHILLRQIDLREVQGSALGQAFYDWLDAVLKGGVYPVNRENAMFHRVEQGMFVVSPSAFRTFINERCQYGHPNSYGEVQQGLQPLGLHIKNGQGRNVHKALISDSTSTLNGFLFPVDDAWAERYAINPHVTLEVK